jgi:hypothetical protein
VTRSTNGPLFKRERACTSGSVAHLTHNVLATASSREVGNRRGCHKRSGYQNRWDATLRRADKWRLCPNPRENKSRGAGHQLAAMRQPPAGSVLEPACPETAGDTPRDSTSRPTTSEPDEGSWDFDGRELTSARNRTRRSPMLTHETSPVSGASVVGMTICVGQGQNYLSADVPGITTALGQRGRLRPKGRSSRLATSSAEARAGEDDETPPTNALPKVAWPRQDQQRQETGVTLATLGLHQSTGKTLLHERIRGREGGICSQDAGLGDKGTL